MTEIIFNLILKFLPILQYLLKWIVFWLPLRLFHLIDFSFLVLVTGSRLFVHEVLVKGIIRRNIRIKSVVLYVCNGGAQPRNTLKTYFDIKERLTFSWRYWWASRPPTEGRDGEGWRTGTWDRRSPSGVKWESWRKYNDNSYIELFSIEGRPLRCCFSRLHHQKILHRLAFREAGGGEELNIWVWWSLGNLIDRWVGLNYASYESGNREDYLIIRLTLRWRKISLLIFFISGWLLWACSYFSWECCGEKVVGSDSHTAWTGLEKSWCPGWAPYVI